MEGYCVKCLVLILLISCYSWVTDTTRPGFRSYFIWAKKTWSFTVPKRQQTKQKHREKKRGTKMGNRGSKISTTEYKTSQAFFFFTDGCSRIKQTKEKLSRALINAKLFLTRLPPFQPLQFHFKFRQTNSVQRNGR